jgi:hypothetical protein
MKGCKVTQSQSQSFGFREKIRKLAYLLKGIKRPNRFIDSFLEERCIAAALIEYFFSESLSPLCTVHKSLSFGQVTPFCHLIMGVSL